MDCAIKPAVVGVLFLFSSLSFAFGNSPWTTVEEIVQGQGNKPLVKLVNAGEAGTGCDSKDYLRIKDADSGAGKRQFSILLAALSSGAEVLIESKTCLYGSPAVETVYIKR
ncbi:hypothetical protein ABF162_07575 [Vibrio coralliilyticus]|uniref:hypothetical protein n=1 Tax=Vibrio coralliilyticus TaxID=190893 RepID=UPI000512949E|nr:hypothetical protein [Vibrio coralliilyticus]AIU66877.1 hypothetical protein JV59_31550 [Vibrio coralliilyticus]